MKKILSTLSLLLLLVVAVSAQVTISGTVTDANGSPMGGYPVHISGDSTAMFPYFNTVFTNANGVYTDNAQTNATQGAFYISVQDSCTLNLLSQTVLFSPGQTTFNNIDFSICTITPPSCQVTLTSTSVVDSLASFTTSLTGGTGPWVYHWDFGDGNTSVGSTSSYTHIYTANGTYTVCVVATDATGCTSVSCVPVTITGASSGGGSNCSSFFLWYPDSSGTGLTFHPAPVGTAPFTYAWDMGDGTTYNGSIVNHTYNTPNSLYLACLTITDATGCTSTFCDTVMSFVAPQCGVWGLLDNVSGNTATMSANATGGAAPYTYAWDFGDGNTGTGASVTHTYAATGSYTATVTMTDASGCSSTDFIFVSITTPPTAGDISGFIVHDSTIFIQNAHAVIYLIEHDTAAGTLTAIATDTTYTGSFYFGNVPFGSYYVKGALLPSDPQYNNYLPTYFFQSLYWANAQTVDINPNMPYGYAFIDMVNGNNVGNGPGFIGGLISQGANRTGDPLANVEVILFDANMNPIAYTYTDANGNYNFDNLPYGTYYIYVEELGLQTAPIQVTLSPTTPTMDQVHFEVGRNYVMFTSTNTITSLNSMKTFPNPVMNELNVQFNAAKMLDLDISVTNLTGQVLVSERRMVNSGVSNISVMTNDLPTGVYMLRIQNEEGVITQKFIKQ